MPVPSSLPEFIRHDPQGKLAQGIASAQLVSLLRQLEGFIREIDQILGTIPAQESDGGATHAGLQHLRDSLIEFHGFSWDYFEFIAECDRGNLPNQTRALQKIQTELLALRPLVEQRRSSELLGFLNMADALAIDFITKCGLRQGSLYTNQGDDGKIKRFLAFFEESIWLQQRKLAYDRVPSISLPLSTWRSPWLWLGLGHEVGHYVYHNLEKKDDGVSLKVALEEAIGTMIKGKQNQMLWREWLEEVFADIFGILVLGPSYTESFICQILLPGLPNGASMLSNDHDHLPNFLRPFLHFELLRQSNPGPATDLQQEVDRLEELWKTVCGFLIPQEERLAGQDAFGYWDQKRIKNSQLRAHTCRQDHLPAIVKTVLGIVQRYKEIKYYNAEVHVRVKAMAKALAAATPLEQLAIPTLLQERLPTLALTVAWYTWTETSGTRTGRSDTLSNLVRWLAQVTQGERERAYAMRNRSVQPVPDVTDLFGARQQGLAFRSLLDKLTERPTNQTMSPASAGCQLTDRLLNIEFSSVETLTSACIACNDNQVARCYCAAAS